MGPLLTKNIEIDGLNMAYIEKGEGPLILFLHGFPDNALSFSKQIEYFSGMGYRVVAPYMRGYYPSGIAEDGKYYTLSLGKDVISLIRALKEEKAVIVGHDWGATAAYAASLLAPEKVEKLIAVSVVRGTFSKALVSNPEQQRKSWYIFFFQTALAETAIAYNNYAFIERLWKEWGAHGWDIPSEYIERVKETFGNPDVVQAAVSYYRCFFDMSKLSKEEIEEQKRVATAKISVPSLYIHGVKDGCIGAELCEGIEEYFGGEFSKKIIDDAGHFVHLEKPDEFNRLVMDFLNANSAVR